MTLAVTSGFSSLNEQRWQSFNSMIKRQPYHMVALANNSQLHL